MSETFKSLVEDYLKLRDSKCERDYKGHHYWEKIGVVKIGTYYFLIHKCAQCEKIIEEPLQRLETYLTLKDGGKRSNEM